MADLEQWVNVERKDQYVEDKVASKKRLGPQIHFRCKFEKADPAHFKVRVVPQGSPAAYTKKERGRNANFKLREADIRAKPDGKEALLETDRWLPCAGGNRFLVEAKYKDKIVRSATVLAARRRLFYQVLSMQGLTPESTASLEADLWNPSKNFYLKLKEKGPRSTIKFLKTLHDGNSGLQSHNDFVLAAKAGYALESRRPYAFTIVFSNFIAGWDKDRFIHTEDVSLPSRIVSWVHGAANVPTKVRVQLPYYAWWEMDPAHDAAGFWLKQNRGSKFVAADGAVIPINAADMSIVGPPDFSKGGYSWLEISLLPELRNKLTERKGKLKIDIEYRFVASWTMGFSYNIVNLVTAAKYAMWEPVQPAQLEYTLNHEVGHKIGMVATGKGLLPNAPSTYYQESAACKYGGHVGPHCKKGATYLAPSDSWTGVPGCVMFGADGTALGNSPKTFCDECAKIVRKLDLDPHNLDGFTRSVKDYF